MFVANVLAHAAVESGVTLALDFADSGDHTKHGFLGTEADHFSRRVARFFVEPVENLSLIRDDSNKAFKSTYE